ncbi:MAG: hypothetical protein AW11_01571 [Candidatus Accumulibacter regalis]|jgi:hypothetical protein|uniref:Uncharacterized protein n=2 Tax=Candidatus Accumulibacter TaxID=327159 RepID=A0A011P2P6_ACCRE|nr:MULTISPECIES: hypothetical protein [unclassified Candidatus Accumulibacter]EXI89248.1 MAG: hypothetical protein AW11_01571 [Candidatus Accumulibacter regalis]MBL8368087.1 hypothetical protein [Accumulibacter sp.]MBN8513680.1 hypothetical protein [Accumulibacter sp.]MBO3701178.1 hypothetical protein [Accumulibacter sp.]HRE69260.1 hypothetical protein [Accumulibacter sp.]
MDPESAVGINWGAIALLAVIAAGLVWGLRLFFRQNRKDLESLEETLENESEGK